MKQLFPDVITLTNYYLRKYYNHFLINYLKN